MDVHFEPDADLLALKGQLLDTPAGVGLCKHVAANHQGYFVYVELDGTERRFCAHDIFPVAQAA